jgi:HEAT repeat protein
MKFQMRACKPSRFVVHLWLSLAIVAVVRGQPPAMSADEFGRANEKEKVRALRELAVPDRGVVSPNQLNAILTVALADSNANVREAALRSVAGRVSDAKPEGLELWMQLERPALLSLRPQLTHLLEDPVRDVRLAAVEATSTLEYDLTQHGKQSRILHANVGRILAARYLAEPDDVVRSRIVNVFVWFSADKPLEHEAKGLFARALQDPSPAVLQAAVMGVGEHNLAELLPEAVKLLSHTEYALRNSAAQAIGEFGAAAVPYLADLRAALARESNSMARSTLQAAIAKVAQ